MAPQSITEESQDKSILSSVSMPTVLAATLAAATSFLFSSKLGLTGSLIGAALAAGVSTIASQVYKAMINSSVEKIQGITTQMQALGDDQDQTSPMEELDRTRVRPVPEGLYEPEDLYADEEDVFAPTGTPYAPAQMRQEAARRHAVSIMRRTFVVAVVAALVALLAYAVMVNLATQGKGIGPTSFEEIVTPTASETIGEVQEQPTDQQADTSQDPATTDAQQEQESEDAGTDDAGTVDAGTPSEGQEQAGTAESPVDQQPSAEPLPEGDGGTAATPTAPATDAATTEG